jgi:hypothetical protein
MKKKITAIGCGVSHVALFGAVCVMPLTWAVTAANASAIGYDYWGVHTFKDIPIPAGQLTGGVWGDGLYVHDAGGNFLSAGNICNWHVDIDLIDSSGKTYRYLRGTPVQSCSHEGTQKWLLKQKARPGKACVRLFTAFTDQVASVCHNITR